MGVLKIRESAPRMMYNDRAGPLYVIVPQVPKPEGTVDEDLRCG